MGQISTLSPPTLPVHVRAEQCIKTPYMGWGPRQQHLGVVQAGEAGIIGQGQSHDLLASRPRDGHGFCGQGCAGSGPQLCPALSLPHNPGSNPECSSLPVCAPCPHSCLELHMGQGQDVGAMTVG